MHLPQIQAYAVAQIAADSVLAAFGPALAFSHFTEDETARENIEQRLRAYGVCIEIGSVEAHGDGSKPQSRYTVIEANFDVYLAENPLPVHTPTEMDLVARVATAMQARTSATSPAIRCTDYAAAKSENGYILHVLTFTLSAIL